MFEQQPLSLVPFILLLVIAYDGIKRMVELHPVYAIQKIDSVADSGDFDGWRTRWCDALSSIPPFDGLGVRPPGMSPQQSMIYDNQVAPENQWFFHPLIDGCTPAQPALR